MSHKEHHAKTSSTSANLSEVTAGDVLRAIGAFVTESVGLLALEGRLAIISLIVMLAAGLVAAVLLLTVWFFLLAALAVLAVNSGWPWSGVLLCIAAANALLALLCWFVIRRLSRNLLFEATLRNLRLQDRRSADDAQTDPT